MYIMNGLKLWCSPYCERQSELVWSGLYIYNCHGLRHAHPRADKGCISKSFWAMLRLYETKVMQTLVLLLY